MGGGGGRRWSESEERRERELRLVCKIKKDYLKEIK